MLESSQPEHLFDFLLALDIPRLIDVVNILDHAVEILAAVLGHPLDNGDEILPLRMSECVLFRNVFAITYEVIDGLHRCTRCMVRPEGPWSN